MTGKKKWCVLFFSFALIAGAHAAEKWEMLFNGKNFSGWQKLNGTAEFRIEGDVVTGIARMNTPNTFLATKKSYSDFILEYEVWLDRRLNSGVQIRSLSAPDFQNGRVHGYQVELDPSARAWSGGIYDEARRGWLYHLEYNPEAKEAFRQEEWNHFRVEAAGNRIRVWVNGVQTADLVDDMTSEGFIALQVHSIYDESMDGAMVKFRNMRIISKYAEKYFSPDNPDILQVSYLNNQLTGREKEAGWQLLWDGKTTQGWRSAWSENFPQQGWSINNGILTVHASGGLESAHGGDIVTEKQYGQFILDVDFKYTKGANSGIKYFVDCSLNEGAGSAIGCEFQILDDDHHPDAKLGVNGNRTLGSLYDLITADAHFYAPDESTSKRVNHYGWNRARIISRGRRVEHYLNGIKILEYDRGTHMWKALVAYSKYRDWPDFGELEKGNILLQDHGDEVHFRNIKINVLD